MASYISYLFGIKQQADIEDESFTVAVAESVTAGALSNSLCTEPGASTYFKGGIVAYSIASKKELLKIDVKYAEENNFANPFTTSEMAKVITKMFSARIGISTTGYSLPVTRPENKERNECFLEIKVPYAYICLYDSKTGFEKIKRVEFPYDIDGNKQIQRATMQTKVALEGRKMYLEYVESFSKEKLILI
jgi:PncC family amidohydrolase